MKILFKYFFLISIASFFISCSSEVEITIEDDQIANNSDDLTNLNTVDENPINWDNFDMNVYIALQDTSLDDFVYQFNFDNSAPLGSAFSHVDDSEVILTGNIRSLSMTNNGNILMGAHTEAMPPIYDTDYNLLTNTSPIGAIDPIVDSHALCALPNGNYIIAEGADTTGNAVNEYDSDDNFVRAVYTTVKGDHGSITECYAIDSETIVWIETGTWSFTNSNLMKLKLAGNTWVVDQLLDSEAFDPGNNTNFWNLEVHSDGHVYFSPLQRNGTRFNQLLKCPIDNFSVGSCSAFGASIPGEGGGNYLTWGRGLVQIPGSNDMLMVISREVYHLDYDTGAYTLVLDLTTLLPTIDVVRSVILAPK